MESWKVESWKESWKAGKPGKLESQGKAWPIASLASPLGIVIEYM